MYNQFYVRKKDYAKLIRPENLECHLNRPNLMSRAGKMGLTKE